jgi:dCTP deaminase
MALSDKKIIEEMKKGDILIHPFNKSHLSTSSYDVTLGEFYFREARPDRYQNKIYNIWDPEHIKRVWHTKCIHKAKKAKEVFKNINFEYNNISPDDKIILLEPGETILAHTNEFIGGIDHITTMMKARSSLGRSFIEVCKCAGWGDVGYVNRWTMEITNNSQHYSIPLVVGRRVAQIVFFETGKILGDDYTSKGKYNVQKDIASLQKNWKPEMMIPQLHKDRDIKSKK